MKYAAEFPLIHPHFSFHQVPITAGWPKAIIKDSKACQTFKSLSCIITEVLNLHNHSKRAITMYINITMDTAIVYKVAKRIFSETGECKDCMNKNNGNLHSNQHLYVMLFTLEA